MENRFGVKDFFLFLLLIVLIVVILLAMKQFDRQYQIVNEIDNQGRDQLRELIAIHNALDRGVSLGQPTTQSSASVDSSFPDFARLHADGKYVQGDWLVMNFPELVENITPIISTSLYAQEFANRVVETLAYPDPATLKFVPLLAESWTTSPDGLSITFNLRKHVTFSDGTPMTADDVVFSYELGTNPKVDGPAYKQQFDRCESCKKIDDYTVVFKFKEPFFQSFESVGASLYILPKSFYGKYTIDQINNSVGLLMGTGPYKMADPASWRPNPGKMELLRNDRYWGIPPSFDRMVFSQIQQENTEFVNFVNGDQDIISLPPQQYRLMLDRPEVVARTNHYEFDTVLSGYIYTAWNQQRNKKPTIFADKRVRQAMTMLTDRQGLCKSILLGYATPAAGPFATYTDQHDPALADWPYDPDRAKALLKEAGFEERGHGILEKEDGTRLSFKLTFGAKNETFDRVARYMKDTYARAGVQMDLDPIDFSILLQRVKTRDYDVLSLGWGGGSVEQDLYQMFHSSQMEGDGDDFMSYKNPELDKAIEAARRTIDDKERMEYWHKCEQILHEDQPYTFLFCSKQLRFMDKRIENFHVTKAGSNLVMNWSVPMPWYVPTTMQKYK